MGNKGNKGIKVLVRPGESVEKVIRKLKRILEREGNNFKRYFEKPSERKRKKTKELRFKDYLRKKRERD